jgi:hypothetical protein
MCSLDKLCPQRRKLPAGPKVQRTAIQKFDKGAIGKNVKNEVTFILSEIHEGFNKNASCAAVSDGWTVSAAY